MIVLVGVVAVRWPHSFELSKSSKSYKNGTRNEEGLYVKRIHLKEIAQNGQKGTNLTCPTFVSLFPRTLEFKVTEFRLEPDPKNNLLHESEYQ